MIGRPCGSCGDVQSALGGVGGAEVVTIDRDTKAVRRWRRGSGGPRLVEEPPAPDGRVALDAVAGAFRQMGDRLEVTTAAGSSIV